MHETLEDIGCYIVMALGAIGTAKIIGEYLISELRLRKGRKEIDEVLRESNLEHILQHYKERYL